MKIPKNLEVILFRFRKNAIVWQIIPIKIAEKIRGKF